MFKMNQNLLGLYVTLMSSWVYCCWDFHVILVFLPTPGDKPLSGHISTHQQASSLFAGYSCGSMAAYSL